MKLSGTEIIDLQRQLHLQPTGIYDNLTEAAVRNYQLKNSLPVTGEMDIVTRESIFVDEIDLSSDLMDRYDNFIQDYFLPEDQYIKNPTKKEYLFIHHTAGWNNPYRVVDMWGSDKRGRIGTQYVIGGINPKTGDDSYDGVVLRCFEDEYYAWHLGSVDRYMHKHSIGIELCNFGYATKRGKNFYSYTGTKLDESQIIDLGYKFRGHRYWQSYSDKQLKSLRNLIVYLTELNGISTYLGLQEKLNYMSPKEAFEYSEEARHGEVKGILSHASVRKDKYDVSPQENLIDMLLGL